jgi:hypothetical protein
VLGRFGLDLCTHCGNLLRRRLLRRATGAHGLWRTFRSRGHIEAGWANVGFSRECLNWASATDNGVLDALGVAGRSVKAIWPC